MVHFKFDSENVFCLKMSHLAKSYKKKVVFTNFRNFKIFFRQIKISCCLQNISKFHIGQINHAWLRAFWKKKFQKFQKLGKKNFPHKIPQGPPQAGPLCLGVFPSCHNTFHQIWSNSSFLPLPPLLYRLSEFTLKCMWLLQFLMPTLFGKKTMSSIIYQTCCSNIANRKVGSTMMKTLNRNSNYFFEH